MWSPYLDDSVKTMNYAYSSSYQVLFDHKKFILTHTMFVLVNENAHRILLVSSK